MSASACDPDTFYRERIPAQFNRTLDAQEQAAAGDDDDAAKRLLEGMRTVKATIDIVVRDGDREQRYHLNVDEGRMTTGDAAAHAPFMTLIHDLDALSALIRESGDSILGFLGALAGMQEDMKLTSQRIQNLHGLDGSLRFALTGENAFTLLAHFGGTPPPDEPSCSISVDGAAYQELRSGALPPQDAFLSGKVVVEGDMQMAMQLALAAMSPE